MLLIIVACIPLIPLLSLIYLEFLVLEAQQLVLWACFERRRWEAVNNPDNLTETAIASQRRRSSGSLFVDYDPHLMR